MPFRAADLPLVVAALWVLPWTGSCHCTLFLAPADECSRGGCALLTVVSATPFLAPADDCSGGGVRSIDRHNRIDRHVLTRGWCHTGWFGCSLASGEINTSWWSGRVACWDAVLIGGCVLLVPSKFVPLFSVARHPRLYPIVPSPLAAISTRRCIFLTLATIQQWGGQFVYHQQGDVWEGCSAGSPSLH